MRTRPWPIMILAGLHLLAPFPNWLVSSWVSQMSPFEFLKYFDSSWEAFYFFGIFPLGGLAIYAMKTWSYPLYLGVLATSFKFNYESFLFVQENHTTGAGVLILAYAINILLVTYFLIPAVRTAYFNKNVRWWETKPRYKIEIPAAIHSMNDPNPAPSKNSPEKLLEQIKKSLKGSPKGKLKLVSGQNLSKTVQNAIFSLIHSYQWDSLKLSREIGLSPYEIDRIVQSSLAASQHNGSIVDLSEGGVFLFSENLYQLEEVIRLHFSYGHLDISVLGKVVHHKKDKLNGYGLQFIHLNSEDEKKLKKLTHALKILGFEPRDKKVDFKADFKSWSHELLTTGKGWVPNPRNRQSPETPQKKNNKKKAA